VRAQEILAQVQVGRAHALRIDDAQFDVADGLLADLYRLDRGDPVRCAVRSDPAGVAHAHRTRAVHVDAGLFCRAQHQEAAVCARVDHGVQFLAVDDDLEMRIRAVVVAAHGGQHDRVLLPQQQLGLAAFERAVELHPLGAQVEFQVRLQQERGADDAVVARRESGAADHGEFRTAAGVRRTDGEVLQPCRVEARESADALDIPPRHEHVQVAPGHGIHRHVGLAGACVDQHRGRRAVDRAVDRGFQGFADVADGQAGDFDVGALGRRVLGVDAGRGAQRAQQDGEDPEQRRSRDRHVNDSTSQFCKKYITKM